MIPSHFAYFPETGTLQLSDWGCSEENIESDLASLATDVADHVAILDLSHAYRLKHLPKSLKTLPHLKVVRLERCHWLESLENLEGLHIEELYANRCGGLRNLNELRELPLRKLDISHDLGLKSLDALKGLIETLEELSIEGMPHLRTTASILPLRKLKVLNISHTGITDTSTLQYISTVTTSLE